MTGFAVACCGCGSVLMADGSLYQIGGIIDLSNNFLLDGKGIDWEKAASFPTREAVDGHARSIGWTVIAGNHRCPRCSTPAKQEGRRGMYIDLGGIS